MEPFEKSLEKLQNKILKSGFGRLRPEIAQRMALQIEPAREDQQELPFIPEGGSEQ